MGVSSLPHVFLPPHTFRFGVYGALHVVHKERGRVEGDIASTLVFVLFNFVFLKPYYYSFSMGALLFGFSALSLLFFMCLLFLIPTSYQPK